MKTRYDYSGLRHVDPRSLPVVQKVKKPRKTRKKVIGVYVIENKLLRKAYIGRSINVDVRLRNHKHSLSKGNHPNKMLQDDWMIHTNSFIFNTLEECQDVKHASAQEKHHIQTYIQQGYDMYNIVFVPENQSHTLIPRIKKEYIPYIKALIKAFDAELIDPEAFMLQLEQLQR